MLFPIFFASIVYCLLPKFLDTDYQAAVEQSVRVIASPAEGWIFKSQTLAVKTGSDSFIAKRSAISVSVTCPRR